MIFFKEKFRSLRESCGFTLKEIANSCNVAESSVHNWESGTGIPRPGRIPKLATLLHCQESDLVQYGEPGAKAPEPPPENKLLFYRKRARMTRRQLAKKIGVDEYTVEAWETYAKIYDQKYDPKIQEALGLTDAQMCELDEESIKSGMAHQAALHNYRASLRGEPSPAIRAAVEEFRDRAIKAIIPLEIDPEAKDKILQTITKL